MTNVQLPGHQDSMANTLSAEAKEFIPRQFVDPVSPAVESSTGLLSPAGVILDENGIPQPMPVNGLPSYITTCYPFVATNDNRFGGLRPRFRGKYPQQTMYMPPHFQPMQAGMPRNRFPNPGKGFIPPSGWGMPSVSDMYQHYSNLPNGMPFDGGTYQNGYIHTTMPQGLEHNSKSLTSPVPHLSSADGYPETPHITNGYIGSPKQRWKNKQKKDKPGKVDAPAKTSKPINHKNSTVQTDFPESIANATLEETPNTLFNSGLAAYKDHHKLSSPSSRRSRNSSSNSTNSANTDCSMSEHGQNTISNGTNPAVDFSNTLIQPGHVTYQIGGHVMSSNFAESFSAYSVSPGAFPGISDSPMTDNSGYTMQTLNSNLVPYLNSNFNNAISVPHKPSYASIAQSKPSQIKSSDTVDKQKVVTMTTEKPKSDQSNCDKSRKRSEEKQFSKNSVNSRLGNVNVNVAEIMQDLERADNNLNRHSNHSQEDSNKGKSLYSAAVKEKAPVVSHAISQKDVKASESKGQGQNKLQGHSQGKANQTKHSQNQVKGHQGHSDLDLSRSDLDIDRKGQGLSQSDNNNNQEDGDAKKKRRRRRRRKKKTGEVETDENSGAKEEITLHFEDEEEFPDLATNSDNVKSSPVSPAFLSYSEILTNHPPVQSIKSSAEEQPVSEESLSASPIKESRTSRKRRKRRECANKAADAELAEINLEQHMLELKMKQKLPLTAKKSVSPVRAATTQGVWKLTPSSPTTQPSSTGKKVSLLLPGTIASEPSHNAPPHQPNSAAVKQPGILKMSQSQINTSGKKSKQPITYDLGALIDALESKKEKMPPPKKDVKSLQKKDEARPANLLDSSAPSQKRGKERETPKTKKPSPLKKVILKEREEKKRLRLLDEDEVASGLGMMPATAFPNSPISAPVGIGVVSGGESDLSQDASFKGSMDVGLGTPASAELSPISQQSPSCMSPMSPGASPLSSGVNSPVTGTIQQTVKLKIHSRRFREYCNQVLDKEIDNNVTALLQDLVRFQDKQFHKDPAKAKAKRRFVLGLREVTKHLKLRKIKCVIISPNLEKIQSKGGLDDALNLILELCNEQKVPFIFALGRRALGRACAKLVPVSVVGVFNYEGSEENFKSLVALTEKAREAYREMIVQIEKEIAEHPPRTHVPGVPHIFAHMGHSRTPSGCSVISFTSSILSEPISENYPHSEPETDNRGYEIEKEDEQLDDNVDHDDNGRDPYEADDERGYNNKKKVKNVYTARPDQDIDGDFSQETNGNKMEFPLVTRNECAEEKGLNGSLELDGSKLETKSESNRTHGKADMESGSITSVPNGEQKLDSDNESGKDLDNDGSDFETCESDQDVENRKEEQDVVEDLPTFIDSVHHFDLNEILSQHSSKTVENGEDVMSTHSSKTTHSSRTLGESSGMNVDKTGKMLEVKNIEKCGGLSVKSKSGVDKTLKDHRTMSWVKEAQNLHFSEQVDQPVDGDENVVDVKNVKIECLDVLA